MKLICKHNDPDTVSKNIPNNFDFGLVIDKEYLAMGILNFKSSNQLYFLLDEGGKPSWYPFQLFQITNNKIPPTWYLKINIDNDNVDYLNLISFKEMTDDEDFFNQLLLRDEYALSTYYRRKIEIETER